MGNRLLSLLLILPLLAACTAPVPRPTPETPATKPAATATTRLAVESASYSESLLLARWDTKIRQYMLMPVDPLTGKAIPDHAFIDLGVNYYHAFSPDRKTLAIITYTNDSTYNPVLHIIDLADWKERTFKLEGIAGWTNSITLSPDGSILAAALTDRDSSLFVFDLKHNTIAAQVDPGFNVTRLRFTQDGTALMAYGNVLVDRFTERERNQGSARVALFAVRDLRLRWSAEVNGLRDGMYAIDENSTSSLHQPGNSTYFNPGVVFAPKQDILYAVHADEEKLTSVDFTGRSMRTLDIKPELSWIEQILMLGSGIAHAKMSNGTQLQAVISPDGETIYTTGSKNESNLLANGDWEYISTPLSFKAIRISDGSTVFEKDIHASSLSISPDGSRLFLIRWKDNDPYGSSSTDVLDLRTLAFGPHYAGTELLPVRRMDGSLVLVSAVTMPNSGEANATRMIIHDYTTGNLAGEWVSPTYASWLTSP